MNEQRRCYGVWGGVCHYVKIAGRPYSTWCGMPTNFHRFYLIRPSRQEAGHTCEHCRLAYCSDIQRERERRDRYMAVTA